MGFGGISPWSLLIILVIILLLFGTKRLRNMGGDLGGAFKSFKKSMKDDDEEAQQSQKVEQVRYDDNDSVIDAEVKQKDKDKV
jgi:sec-independent protein translocase protein TatA